MRRIRRGTRCYRAVHVMRLFCADGHARQVIVYFLTCACVDFYSDALAMLPQLSGVSMTALHGRMKQARGHLLTLTP